MRIGYEDSSFIKEGGKLIGIALGYGWCAEHEWGTSV